MGIFQNLFGSKISIDEVIDFLEEVEISTQQARREDQAEGHIHAQLLELISEHYDNINVHKQYNVPGYLGLRVDIDIDERIGIEIKLSSQLLGNATNMQRLIGQAVYYSTKKYEDNLIILIVGKPVDSVHPALKELTSILEDLEITVFFLETI